jgi:uncharacterized protein (DUF2267 family)
MTGLEVFDRTIHRTNIWLKDLMETLGTESRQRAYSALRATLHATRDRLTIEETAQLGAQLPMLLRGSYYEGWVPARMPVKAHREQFLARIAEELRAGAPSEVESIARAVFAVIARRVSEGEIEDVKHVVPQDIRDLWPSQAGLQSCHPG